MILSFFSLDLSATFPQIVKRSLTKFAPQGRGYPKIIPSLNQKLDKETSIEKVIALRSSLYLHSLDEKDLKEKEKWKQSQIACNIILNNLKS